MADLATKQIALASFTPHDPVELMGGLLKLTLVFNSGAAFSIGNGYPWIFVIITAVVVGAILWAVRRLRSRGWATALGLVMGGAVGNLLDRVYFAPEPYRWHVVDWIQVPNWPVFNLADSAIVCGGILAVLMAFRGINLDGSRDSDKSPDSRDEAGQSAAKDDGRE